MTGKKRPAESAGNTSEGSFADFQSPPPAKSSGSISSSTGRQMVPDRTPLEVCVEFAPTYGPHLLSAAARLGSLVLGKSASTMSSSAAKATHSANADAEAILSPCKAHLYALLSAFYLLGPASQPMPIPYDLEAFRVDCRRFKVSDYVCEVFCHTAFPFGTVVEDFGQQHAYSYFASPVSDSDEGRATASYAVDPEVILSAPFLKHVHAVHATGSRADILVALTPAIAVGVFMSKSKAPSIWSARGLRERMFLAGCSSGVV